MTSRSGHYVLIIAPDVPHNYEDEGMSDYRRDVRLRRRVSLAVRLAALPIMLALVQCSADAEPAVACDCVADPVPHCVAKPETACRDSSECASGLICRETLESGKRCRPETQTSRPLDLLTAGFGVPRQRLVRGDSERGLGVYHWSAVKDADYVSCALFACLPEVGLDERERLSIVTYDKCVLARETMPIDPVVPFTVGGDSDTTYRPSTQPPAACRLPLVKAPRKVTRLAVGCIAYNAIDLVAASQLLFVSPEETGTFGGTIPASATCSTDHDECYDADADTFGTCLDGKCRARCLSASDCCEPLETGGVDAGVAMSPALTADRKVCPDGGSVECVLPTARKLGVCRAIDPKEP
jgi:hypothetical protein